VEISGNQRVFWVFESFVLLLYPMFTLVLERNYLAIFCRKNGYKAATSMGGRGSPNNHRSILSSIHARIKFFTIAILGENSKNSGA